MSKSNLLTRTQIDQLTLFVKRAKQLPKRACYSFLTSYKSSYKLEWKQGNLLQLTNFVKPEVETFRSYLIDFRLFVSQEEDVFVSRVLNICINRARHIAFRNQLIALKNTWNESSKMIRDITKETPDRRKIVYKGNKVFLNWLNGTIFHLDTEAEEFFENWGILRETFEIEAARYIGWCSNFILQLAHIINHGLKNNNFDFDNEHTPHNKPNVEFPVEEHRKASVIEFWNSTKNLTQTLSICEEHDQDPIIVVEGYQDGMTDLKNVKVELHGCCHTAIGKSIIKIEKALQWFEYLKNNRSVQNSEPMEILEVEITDEKDIQCIKIALENYKQKWRKAVGKMRCSIHRFAPGARAFGEDIYHQAYSTKNDSVYLQACCVPFIKEVLEVLRELPNRT